MHDFTTQQSPSHRQCFAAITNLQLAPPLRVTLFEFCRDFPHQKTRVPGLSCGVVCMILCLAFQQITDL